MLSVKYEIPESIVANAVFLQDGEELLFHSPIDSTVVTLVDSGLDIAIGFADIDEFLQQLWLEIRDTKLEILVLAVLYSNDLDRSWGSNTFLNLPALCKLSKVSACSSNGVAMSGKWTWSVLTCSTPMRCKLVLRDFSIAGLVSSPRWSGDSVRIFVSMVNPCEAALLSPISSSERPGEVGGYLPAVSRWVILFSLR